MLKLRKYILVVGLSLMMSSVAMAQQPAMNSSQGLPYLDPSLTPEQRAEDLIPRLTLDEKAKLMLDVSDAIPRLGIPQFQWWGEALHGVGRNGFTTVFPITMGMAASFDDQLLYNVFDAVSDEARVKYYQARKTGTINRYQCLSFWTPNINIFRDPRWGRGQETYGEDPYLTERMGLAVVKGLQAPQPPKRCTEPVEVGELLSVNGSQTNNGIKNSPLGGGGALKLLACAKHFAVHSGPEWNRHSFNIENLPERDLWETYLPAFKSLVQKGNVAEVMCAYQSIDGQPCCGNTRYLQQILRNEWGFKGIVVSDCGALRDFHSKTAHAYTNSPEESSQKAVLTGTDNNCGSTYKSIPKAVKQGLLKESDLDASLKRLLVGRFSLGEMDPDSLVPWSKIPESVLCSKEHSDLAYKMAQEAQVLLQNKNGILPLKKDLKIAVIGPNANDSAMQWGNYNGYPKHTVTILQGIQKKCRNVTYIKGAGYVENSVPVSHFDEIFTPDGEHGVEAEFWNDTNLGKSSQTATVPSASPEGFTSQTSKSIKISPFGGGGAINLNNGGNTVFAPGVELENFSARFKGILKPKKDGKVKVSVEADDGLRLIINGDTVENRFKTAHGVQKRSREITVKAGEEYPIQVDYLQTSGMADFHFDVTHQETLSQDSLIAQLTSPLTGGLEGIDVVVFVGGISPRLEGEEMKVNAKGFKGGDRTDIELPDAQRSLLKAIHDAGKKIVYVNCSGSAIGLVPETLDCDAILQSWYPGERGGDAVADVLFGDYNPSGKLPITFYRSTDDLPDFLDYTMTGTSADGKSHGRTYRYFSGKPLFPFGYGLSYTTFEKSKVNIFKTNKKCIVEVEVKNTGKRDGTETIMAYIKCPWDTTGPVKTLRAFQRVDLKAGESKTVTLKLTGDQLLWWDKGSNTMQPLQPKQYEVVVE